MQVIIPTLTTDGTFSRASSATYFNSSGVLTSAGVNVLRIGYDPADLTAPPFAILENAATNICKYSEQLDNAAWVKTTTTVTANSVAAPDGLTTADTLTATSSDSFVAQTLASISPGTIYTFSVWLRSTSPTTMSIYLNDTVGGSGSTQVLCNVTTAWTRFFVSRTTGASVTSVSVQIGGGGSFSTGEVLYAWGGQLEAGSAATSYIATTSVNVSRSADITTNGLLYSSVVEPEAGYPAWNSATSYSIDAPVTYLHRRYKALRDTTNINRNPLTDTTVPKYWNDVGPTNRYAMFDTIIGTSSVDTNNITVVIKGNNLSGLSLMQMQAEMVKINVSVDNVTQYSASLDLVSGIVLDWFEYFNQPIEQITDYAILDLPNLTGAVITLVFTSSSTVSVGNVVLGNVYKFLNTGSSSATSASPTIGITDYSVKTVDAFGNTTFIVRGYSKKLNAKLMIDSESVDKAVKVLTSVRATACVWVGAENAYESMIVYGYYKDWEVEIAYPTKSYCSLQIEGLI